ncbi:porin PorA family protein [Corynebacterium nasicanis]|uniref:Porin PorA family protein n=1 Tax=Corynebacterium nasicanis TaxID=1448267 RepID=A0ABW1QC15_9CORY
MSQSLFRRRPIQLLLIAALLFVLSSAVPPAVIALLRPLDVGQSLTFSTRPNETMSLLAPIDGSQGIPAANRDRPECQGSTPLPASYACYVLTVPSRQVTALTTSESDTADAVQADAVIQVRFGEDVLTEMHDSVLLDARSTFPVGTPVSQMSISVPDLASGMASEPFVREGLQYFFPFPTARQSYPWFDMTAQEPLLLDYVGETEHHGVETFEFHHRLDDRHMDRTSSRAISMPAEVNGLLDHLADSAVGIPSYAVDRRVWVEPETGTIIDIRAEYHLFFAAGEEETTHRSFAPDPAYTIYHTVSEWDDATIAQQSAEASSVLTTLRSLQILAVLGKALALLAALWAVVLLLRERRSR